MPSEEYSAGTISRRIALKELHKYVSSSAYIAEDIIAPHGHLLVPKGTRLAYLGASLKTFEENLRLWGFLSIPITMQKAFDVADLESILQTARDQIPNIDSQLTQETITQIENVFSRITNGTCSSQDVSLLAEQGRTIAKEVSRAPQLMLCLGKVRRWDRYTYVHSLNVALLSGFLANRIFPGRPEIAENVSVGALLHDLGKALIPLDVLNKPGSLSDEELTIMKNHAVLGFELAKSNGIKDLSILSVIRGHHERYSGNGYPDGLTKNNIRMEARIAAVSDVFDALTAKRVYKDAITSREAVSIMIDSMNEHFDPAVVRALLVSVGLFPPGTGVELSDGSLGVIVGSRGNDLMRPEVLLHIDNTGNKVKGLKIIDLSKSEDLYVRFPINDVGKTAF